MSGLADFMFLDDDGHMIRALLRRIDILEAARANDVPVSGVVMHPGPLRSEKWSRDRLASVGTNYTRWYKLNEVNQDHSLDDIGGNPANRLVRNSTDWPLMGQPGGLKSEGSYSLDCTGPATLLQAPVVTTAARDWSIEAIFMADTLPQNDVRILYNDTYGFLIAGAAGGSGSHLVVHQAGVGYVDMGAIAQKQWYHAIAVSDSSDNTIKWYLGTFAFPSMIFTYTSGSSAVSAPSAPSGLLTLGGFDGRIDEALVYNGKIPSGSARLSAEDRIRVGMQPGPPSGYAVADGSVVARQEYPSLFAKYGTIHGAGDGSTTFSLPNIPGGILKL